MADSPWLNPSRVSSPLAEALARVAQNARAAERRCRCSDVLGDSESHSAGDLVFRTSAGGPLDAANVRREFRAVCKKAGIGETWTPRELRHTFVSLMSDSDVAVEETARLVGHASSKVTETIYRHQLRAVMTTGAEKMDELLGMAG